MSLAAAPEEQLIDLLLQLRKTTPEQARAILSTQPQIGHSLLALMFKMNAINPAVLQQTFSAYQAPVPVPPTAPSIAQPISAIPPYLNPHSARSAPSTSQAPMPPYVAPYNSPAGAYPNSGNAPNPLQTYSRPPSQPPMLPKAWTPDTLAHLPQEQKDMIAQVIQLTPDQIKALAPDHRQNVLQIREALGLR